MLKRFRNTGKNDRRDEEEVIAPDETEMTFTEAFEAETAETAEQQRLNEAREELARVIAQDGSLDETQRTSDIEEAQRKMNFIQRQIEQARQDKEARFHAANKKVLDAEADVALARKQKFIWQQVSDTLEQFKATDVGRDMPDDVALLFSQVFKITTEADPNYFQATQFVREMRRAQEDVATYFAYRKRIGM